jgi:riboflavin kinase/FMN adenylyltransferase
MRTFFLHDNEHLPHNNVATIGFFDGVHRGHSHLIKMVMDAAQERCAESMVITFATHPRQVLDDTFHPNLLTFPDEKMIRLSQTGVDNCVVLPFDHEMANMTAREFMVKLLRDRLGVTTLVLGYDNRFGHGRKEGFDEYVAYGHELGIDVIRATELQIEGQCVSSSVIRQMVIDGDIEKANQFLGYSYMLLGRVVEGFQQGRKLGFPTANLDISGCEKIIPASGVYAVRARIEGQMEMKRAIMNIGTRPTLDDGAQTIETHIINYDGDLYGERLVVAIDKRLREERRFEHVGLLVAQMREDVKKANEYFDQKVEE